MTADGEGNLCADWQQNDGQLIKNINIVVKIKIRVTSTCAFVVTSTGRTVTYISLEDVSVPIIRIRIIINVHILWVFAIRKVYVKIGLPTVLVFDASACTGCVFSRRNVYTQTSVIGILPAAVQGQITG